MAVALVSAAELPLSVRQPPLAGQGRLRKIGLLGSHEASLRFAPWADPSWELWGHASSRGLYKRNPDRYFDRHRKECWTKSNNKGERYLRWLATNTVPIYMLERFPEVPASIRYPFEQVSFGMARKYFTNHAAYMIALALTEGVTHIGFFGVNYGKSVANGAADCEYATQRGSCEYWMGRAEGAGVTLVLPETCTLLAEPKEIYGPESHDAEGKLVPAYQARTWLKPAATTCKVDASGREVMPKGIAEMAARERIDHPPPAGTLGPEHSVLVGA